MIVQLFLVTLLAHCVLSAQLNCSPPGQGGKRGEVCRCMADTSTNKQNCSGSDAINFLGNIDQVHCNPSNAECMCKYNKCGGDKLQASPASDPRTVTGGTNGSQFTTAVEVYGDAVMVSFSGEGDTTQQHVLPVERILPVTKLKCYNRNNSFTHVVKGKIVAVRGYDSEAANRMKLVMKAVEVYASSNEKMAQYNKFVLESKVRVVVKTEGDLKMVEPIVGETYVYAVKVRVPKEGDPIVRITQDPIDWILAATLSPLDEASLPHYFSLERLDTYTCNSPVRPPLCYQSGCHGCSKYKPDDVTDFDHSKCTCEDLQIAWCKNKNASCRYDAETGRCKWVTYPGASIKKCIEQFAT